MTLDEAIKHAEEVAESCEMGNPKKRSKSKCAAEHRQLAEWLRELKALMEEQACEDCISREQAVNTVVNWYFDFLDGKEVEDVVNLLDALPSAQPTRKKGKWINFGLADRYGTHEYKCSNCNNSVYDKERNIMMYHKYCLHCGAEMGRVDGN